jgi:PBP1b-binding outer membrane lipoprotein LpoB
MKLRFALCAVLLAGCATQHAPPGSVVAAERLSAAVVAGRTTKAELLAALGPTKSVRFDSGYDQLDGRKKNKKKK